MAIDPGKQGKLMRDTPGNTGLVFIVSSLFTSRDAGRPIDVRAADQFSRVLADLHRVAKAMTCDQGRERLTGVPGTPHRFLDSPSRRCGVSGPGGPRGLLPWGSHGSVRALSGIRLFIS